MLIKVCKIMITKAKITDMLDCLPEKEQLFVYDFVRRLVIVNNEDIASIDDLRAIKDADEEYEKGETVRFEDVVW